MKRLIAYALLVGVSSTMFLLWQIDLLPTEVQKFVSNYGLHLLGTFGYTLVSGAMVVSIIGKGYGKFVLIGLVAAAIAVATLNELLQYFDPKREVDKYDVLAQVVGCIGAYLCIVVIGPVPGFREAWEGREETS